MNCEKQQPRQKNGLKGRRTRIVVHVVEKRSITMSIWVVTCPRQTNKIQMWFVWTSSHTTLSSQKPLLSLQIMRLNMSWKSWLTLCLNMASHTRSQKRLGKLPIPSNKKKSSKKRRRKKNQKKTNKLSSNKLWFRLNSSMLATEISALSSVGNRGLQWSFTISSICSGKRLITATTSSFEFAIRRNLI